MANAERKALEAAVWKHTHRDFKGQYESGQKYLLVGSSRGTTFKLLSEFSDEELRARLPTSGRVSGSDYYSPQARLRAMFLLRIERFPGIRFSHLAGDSLHYERALAQLIDDGYASKEHEDVAYLAGPKLHLTDKGRAWVRDYRAALEHLRTGRASGFTKTILSRNYDEEIVAGMARVMFVTEWARRQEERGRSLSGELTAAAPKTSADAKLAAKALAKQILHVNKVKTLTDLYARALNAGGEGSAELFGHYLAAEAMGIGVSWTDSNPAFEITVPDFEYYSGRGRVAKVLGRVEGMTIVTHLIAGAMGYGIARAVEEPEETRALALRAGAKTRELAERAGTRLASEGRRAYSSARKIAGRAYGSASGLDALDAAARDLADKQPRWHHHGRIVRTMLVEVKLSPKGYSPRTMGAYDVLEALQRHGLVELRARHWVETSLGRSIPMGAFDGETIDRAKDALEDVGRSSGKAVSEAFVQAQVKALRKNADDYHHNKIDYAKFSKKNHAVWAKLDASGRAAHDRALELLRGDR